MSGKKVLEFLGLEEVFESYGTEVQLKEIMENGNSDIEMVACIGQFLLRKFMDQNEEINFLQSVLSERDQEMKHLKERQRYLGAIEETYQETKSEMELELRKLQRMNCDYQEEVRRLQRKVVKSNETETTLRKFIFELAKSRKGWKFQQETLNFFPSRNYCLLCLNSKDHSSYHKKQNDEALEQLMLARKICIRLEQEIQAENREKTTLTEKLLALHKEADALTQYIQWLGRGDKDLKPDESEEISEITLLSDNHNNAVNRTVQEDQLVKMDENLIQDETRKIPGTIIDENYHITINSAVEKLLQSKRRDEKRKLQKIPGQAEPKISSESYGNEGVQKILRGQLQNSSHRESEERQSEVEDKMKLEPEKGDEAPLIPKEINNTKWLEDTDDPNMHSHLCIVAGTCHACKAVREKSSGCFKDLFKAILAFLRSLLRRK